MSPCIAAINKDEALISALLIGSIHSRAVEMALRSISDNFSVCSCCQLYFAIFFCVKNVRKLPDITPINVPPINRILFIISSFIFITLLESSSSYQIYIFII